ncbi:hypothetical protein PVAP13_7NG442301 [Panicum virgatum]|uniref:Uncharacterized protein n=1 Tax=Panicum virgatum TaxID=38727 RepID=A0A8T0Q7E6_PANVG|nr:hypothetical protein PVAP13_7NG442301 [Panicum virgatum]
MEAEQIGWRKGIWVEGRPQQNATRAAQGGCSPAASYAPASRQAGSHTPALGQHRGPSLTRKWKRRERGMDGEGNRQQT